MKFAELDQKERKDFISAVLKSAGGGEQFVVAVDGTPLATTIDRRESLAIRKAMLRGNSLPAIRSHIRRRFQTRGAFVSKFATNIYNPMRRLAKRVAVVYKKPAIRTLAGAEEDVSKNFAAMLAELRMDRRMKTLNRHAWALNTMIVVPTPYERWGEQKIRLRFFSGDNAEVIRNEDDPFGIPDVLGYRSGTGGDGASLVTTVDEDGWQEWDKNGKAVGELIEHGLDRFPGSLVRMTDPPDDDDADYWDPDDGMGLQDCCLEVGYIAATMGWIRKAQNRLLMVLLMEDEDGGSEGQINDPEAGMKILASPDQVKLMIENFDQPIGNFLAQIKSAQDETAEAHAGIPSTLADPEQRNMEDVSGRMEEFAALTEVREEQIEEFAALEKDLHPIIHAIARKVGHQHAVNEEALDGLEISFPALQSMDTRKERLDIAIKGTEFGVTDQVDFVMAEHGIDTPERALEFIMRRARRRAKLDDFRASRQQSADPNHSEGRNGDMEEDGVKPGEPLSATQGRKGGRALPPRQDGRSPRA